MVKFSLIVIKLFKHTVSHPVYAWNWMFALRNHSTRKKCSHYFTSSMLRPHCGLHRNSNQVSLMASLIWRHCMWQQYTLTWISCFSNSNFLLVVIIVFYEFCCWYCCCWYYLLLFSWMLLLCMVFGIWITLMALANDRVDKYDSSNWKSMI